MDELGEQRILRVNVGDAIQISWLICSRGPVERLADVSASQAAGTGNAGKLVLDVLFLEMVASQVCPLFRLVSHGLFRLYPLEREAGSRHLKPWLHDAVAADVVLPQSARAYASPGAPVLVLRQFPLQSP